MPNKNYLKGRRYEYEVIKRWKERGYEATRTAGSHSSADVIAWRTDRKVSFIQCKVTDSMATATRLAKRFREDSIPSSNYHTVLTIKVKGSKIPIEVTI